MSPFLKPSPARSPRPRENFYRRWHKRIAVVAALLVVILAVTGILLNHGKTLELDRKTVTHPWLMVWYGLAPATPPLSFQAGDHWLTWLDGRLFLGPREIATMEGRPLGVVAHGEILIAASDRQVLLLTATGEVIERIGAGALPPGDLFDLGITVAGEAVISLRSTGKNGQGKNGQEEKILIADESVSRWTAYRGAPGTLSWSRPSPLPPLLEAEILAAFRGAGLPWSRLLLDFHSGRFLGAWGVYLMDGAALALLLLAASGFVSWGRTSRRRSLMIRKPADEEED